MRKAFILLLLVLLACINQASASKTKDRVLDSLSNIYFEVTPAGNFYIVNQGKLSTLFSKMGGPVFPFKYQNLRQGLNGYFVADDNKAIDTTGRLVTFFSKKVVYVDHVHLFYKIGDNPGNIGLVGADFRELIPVCDSGQFNKGFAPFRTTPGDYTATLYGVRDTFGHVIVPAIYHRILTGGNNMAGLTRDSAFFFNKTGHLLFRCKADEAAVFENDFFGVKLFGLWAVKDANGKSLTPYKYLRLESFGGKGLIIADQGLLNHNGTEVLRPEISSPYPKPGGWVQVGFNGLILDDKQKVVFEEGSYNMPVFNGERFIQLPKHYGDLSPRVYDHITRKFVPYNILNLLQGDTYEIIDKENGKTEILKNNKVVKLPSFTDVKKLEGIPYFKIVWSENTGQPISSKISGTPQLFEITNDRCGLLDENMNLIIPMRYQSIEKLGITQCFLATDDSNTYVFSKKGLLLAKLKGKAEKREEGLVTRLQNNDITILADSSGIIYNGKESVSLISIINTEKSWLSVPELLAITDNKGNYGIYDLKRHLLQPHQYHIVEEKAPGLVTLKKKDSLYFINYKGKMLFGGRGFNSRNCRVTEGCIAFVRDNNHKWGLIDASGKTLLPYIYDSLRQDGNTGNYFLKTGYKEIEVNNTGQPNKIQIASLTTISFGEKSFIKDVDGNPLIPGKYLSRDSVIKYIEPFNQTFVSILKNDAGLPAGIYNRHGKYLTETFADIHNTVFNCGIVIMDTAKNKVSVIDSEGAVMIPWFAMPDLLAVSQYGMLAVNETGECTLYRKNGDCITKFEHPPAFLQVKIMKVFNEFNLETKTIYSLNEGMHSQIKFGLKPALWIEGIDSLYQFNEISIVRKQGHWGLVNPAGEWMCQPVCDSIISKSTDLVLYKQNKTGIYNYLTTSYLPPVYDRVYNTSSAVFNFFLVKKEGKFNILNRNGEELTPGFDSIITQPSILYHLQAINKGKVYWLSVADNGKIKVEPQKAGQYKKAGKNGFFSYLAIVEENGKEGLYSNLKFKWLLPPNYYSIKTNRTGEYIACKKNKSNPKVVDSTLILDAMGRLIVGIKGWHEVERLTEGLWSLSFRGTPVINSKGKVIVPDSFEWVMVSGDLLIASSSSHTNNGRKAIFNRNGDMVSPAIFYELKQFENGYLIGSVLEDSYNEFKPYKLIAKNGKMANHQFYDEIIPNLNNGGSVNNTFFIVRKDSLWGAIDGRGITILNCIYDSVLQIYKNKIALVRNKEGKWGLITLTGKIITPFIYDELGLMQESQAYYRRGVEEGFIDENGKERSVKKLGP